jgi:hypothetical protein
MWTFRAAGHTQYNGEGEYSFFLEKFVVIGTAIGSILLGFFDFKRPWLWPFVIVESFYLAGFALLPHWGQIPPFEIIYMGLLALPGVVTSFLASRAAQSLWRAA